jgi:hypothetical protein
MYSDVWVKVLWSFEKFGLVRSRGGDDGIGSQRVLCLMRF